MDGLSLSRKNEVVSPTAGRVRLEASVETVKGACYPRGKPVSVPTKRSSEQLLEK